MIKYLNNWSVAQNLNIATVEYLSDALCVKLIKGKLLEHCSRGFDWSLSRRIKIECFFR